MTPLQRIMLAYKLAKGFDKDDKKWDKFNFPRFIRPAKEILEAFENEEREAVEFVISFGATMDELDRSWTLWTTAKHSWDAALELRLKNMAKEKKHERLLGKVDTNKAMERSGFGGLTQIGEIIRKSIPSTSSDKI